MERRKVKATMKKRDISPGNRVRKPVDVLLGFRDGLFVAKCSYLLVKFW
jgi:hypothetical protein